MGALIGFLIWRDTAGPTLEELQASVGSADQVLLNLEPIRTPPSAEYIAGIEASVGEADRVFDRSIDPAGMEVFSHAELAALQASVGEADRALDRFVDPAGIEVFSLDELAALQASVGEADRRLLEMTPGG